MSLELLDCHQLYLICCALNRLGLQRTYARGIPLVFSGAWFDW
jgi:hypothetical protein